MINSARAWATNPALMHAFVRTFGTADADEANRRMIERQRREHIEALRRTGVRVQIIQEKD